ncbi:MAG: hypothetical protein K9M36_01285 [Candidatus Pacebacteria bacterium]|nr:hypothetical protein [Candidatus Paceibacterota bacterium]
MFSVGNLVAFRYNYYSSPDGRSSSRGLCPTTNHYLLQEEILLEEYDNTSHDGYGGGDYDIREIVEMSDIFWHEYSADVVLKTFLLQVLETNKNIFFNNFISGDIAEVRNHPGRFLHIYEIPEGYRECEAETFEATVEKINLQKKQEDDFEVEKVAKRYRGIELVFGITANGWYASRASFGKHSVQLQHKHDDTRRSHYRLVIMPCVPNGSYQFYIGGTPMYLHLQDGREPSIDTLTNTHWANSQSWKYCEIQTLTIEKGWIFINGEDVFENTKKIIDELRASQKSARNNKFEELSKIVAEKHSEGILKLVLRKKGSVLAILKVLSESPTQVEIVDLVKILELSSSAPVIANLIDFVASKVNPFKAAKVAEKAYAWSYLRNALPGVGFTGYFEDASTALQIYSKNWKAETRSGDNSAMEDALWRAGLIK